jgi:ligand-binding sensor domain-containing protein
MRLFCLILLACSPAPAQEVFRWIERPVALPTASLSQLRFAQDGSLLALSVNEILRFDGKHISRLNRDPIGGSNTQFLPSPNGQIYLSSQRGLIQMVDGRPRLVNAGAIFSAAPLGDWFACVHLPAGTSTLIFALLRPSSNGDWTLTPYPEIPLDGSISSSPGPLAWASGLGKLYRFSRQSERLQIQSFAAPQGYTNTEALFHILPVGEEIWASNTNHLYSFNPRTKAFARFPIQSQGQIDPELISPRPGELCYLSQRALRCRNSSGESVYPLPRQRLEQISSAVADAAGNIWISLYNFGFLALQRNPSVSVYPPASGLNVPVYGFLAHPKLGMLAGSTRGIFQLDPSSQRWSRWDRTPTPLDLTKLAQQSPQSLLAAGPRGALISFSLDGQIRAKSPPLPMLMGIFHSLHRKPDGQVLLGSNRLYQIPNPEKSLLPEPLDYPVKGEIKDADLLPDGRLALATESGFLLGQPGNWRLIDARDGLRFSAIQCLAKHPAREEYWVGFDNGQGFARIDLSAPGPPKITHFSAAEGFLDEKTFDFLFDSRGRLWRGGVAGVYLNASGDPAPSNWYTFDARNGISSPDVSFNSTYEDPAGNIWIGTTVGTLRFSPDYQPPAQPHSVHLHLSRLTLDGRSYDGRSSDGQSALTTRRPGGVWHIEVAHIQPDLEPQIQYQYRLLPKQPEWRLAPSDRFDLPVPPPGTHTLEVRVQPTAFIQPANTARLTLVEEAPPLSASTLLLLYSASVALALLLYWRRQYLLAWLPIPALRRWQERQFFLALRALQPAERPNALARVPRSLQPALKTLLQDFDQIEESEDERTRSGVILDAAYLLEHVIARGGFATVYYAREVASGHPVAVKIFHQQATEGSWLANRLSAEIESMRRLHHPGVVRLRSHGRTADAKPYLVMDYVAGITLRQALRNGPLEFPRALARIREAAQALEAVHAQGILHRDLKPENILLRQPATAQEATVLIDFGVASVYEAILDGSQSTYFSGSLDYSAPEQIAGLRTPASDIYALAVVAFELLTKKRFKQTFAGQATAESIEEQLQAAQVPHAATWADILARAAHLEHSQRTPSAVEFLHSLDSLP